MRSIWDVEIDQLPVIGRKYLEDIFDVKKSSVAVTCHPSKLESVVEGFKNIGRELRTVTLDDKEFSDL